MKMISSQDLGQLKAFARQDGFFLGLLWVASFACLVYIPTSMMGSLLMLATPFLVCWRLGCYRDEALDGTISLRRGFAYVVYCFIYASFIFAAWQYIYFRYLDGGRFIGQIRDVVAQAMPLYEKSGINASELTQAINQMAALTPLENAFVFMIQNILIGLVVALPLALVCRRKGINKKQ